MPSVQLVTEPADLARALERLIRAERVALDTEGNGMHAYVTLLSVIQLCEARDDAPADDVYVIDPLALGDLTLLAPLLGPGGPTKVVHDVAFDARLLARSGLPLANVLDTAVHARFLGLKETGLSALLAARHGVALDKARQQDDWAQRPLSDAQLAYLMSDVAYLGPLAAGLAREAAVVGIAAEIKVETEYALANARADGESSAAGPGQPYLRLKGVHKLAPAARAALRELAAVREAAAATANVPVGRVVSNDSLLAAAKARPGSVHELKRVARLYDKGAALAPQLLAAIRRGEAAGDVPESERATFVREAPTGSEIAARRARESALTTWRQRESAARGVDPQVVLPGHVLADLVRLAPRGLEELAAVPGFGAVRVARYGEALLALLDEVARSPRRAR